MKQERDKKYDEFAQKLFKKNYDELEDHQKIRVEIGDHLGLE